MRVNIMAEFSKRVRSDGVSIRNLVSRIIVDLNQAVLSKVVEQPDYVALAL
jgi:hypothetical protein